MSTEFNKLLQIRNQKESRQRKIVQDLAVDLDTKKTMLTTLEQSMALFNTQKVMIEKVFFEQISGQEMKPDNLSDYQEKVRQISQFDTDLKIQHRAIVSEIQALDAGLTQALQDLTTAERDVEKIGMVVESEQQAAIKSKAAAEDLEADEQAAEAWNRSN